MRWGSTALRRPGHTLCAASPLPTTTHSSRPDLTASTSPAWTRNCLSPSSRNCVGCARLPPVMLHGPRELPACTTSCRLCLPAAVWPVPTRSVWASCALLVCRKDSLQLGAAVAGLLDLLRSGGDSAGAAAARAVKNLSAGQSNSSKVGLTTSAHAAQRVACRRPPWGVCRCPGWGACRCPPWGACPAKRPPRPPQFSQGTAPWPTPYTHTAHMTTTTTI